MVSSFITTTNLTKKLTPLKATAWLFDPVRVAVRTWWDRNRRLAYNNCKKIFVPSILERGKCIARVIVYHFLRRMRGLLHRWLRNLMMDTMARNLGFCNTQKESPVIKLNLKSIGIFNEPASFETIYPNLHAKLLIKRLLKWQLEGSTGE